MFQWSHEISSLAAGLPFPDILHRRQIKFLMFFEVISVPRLFIVPDSLFPTKVYSLPHSATDYSVVITVGPE